MEIHDAHLDEPGPVGGYPGLALLLICVGSGGTGVTSAVVVLEWRHEALIVQRQKTIECPRLRRREKKRK